MERPYLLLLIKSIVFFLVCKNSIAANKEKPHGHQGVLEPYDGKPLPVHLNTDQKSRLEKGEAVISNERNGKSGRGIVIQDINASIPICMEKIRDLKNYNKMVPHVKSVDIYETMNFLNGSSKTGAKFDVGLLGMRFGYYLMLTHEPKYNTLTWTLDYRSNSDFDDNVGHWQLEPHPSKSGWTRVLYSTKIKLFNWIPEFIINFLTSKALVESTAWVKREAELEQAKHSSTDSPTAFQKPSIKLPKWFNMKGGKLSDCIVKKFQLRRETLPHVGVHFNVWRFK